MKGSLHQPNCTIYKFSFYITNYELKINLSLVLLVYSDCILLNTIQYNVRLCISLFVPDLRSANPNKICKTAINEVLNIIQDKIFVTL